MASKVAILGNHVATLGGGGGVAKINFAKCIFALGFYLVRPKRLGKK